MGSPLQNEAFQGAVKKDNSVARQVQVRTLKKKFDFVKASRLAGGEGSRSALSERRHSGGLGLHTWRAMYATSSRKNIITLGIRNVPNSSGPGKISQKVTTRGIQSTANLMNFRVNSKVGQAPRSSN